MTMPANQSLSGNVNGSSSFPGLMCYLLTHDFTTGFMDNFIIRSLRTSSGNADIVLITGDLSSFKVLQMGQVSLYQGCALIFDYLMFFLTFVLSQQMVIPLCKLKQSYCKSNIIICCLFKIVHLKIWTWILLPVPMDLKTEFSFRGYKKKKNCWQLLNKCVFSNDIT